MGNAQKWNRVAYRLVRMRADRRDPRRAPQQAASPIQTPKLMSGQVCMNVQRTNHFEIESGIRRGWVNTDAAFGLAVGYLSPNERE